MPVYTPLQKICIRVARKQVSKIEPAKRHLLDVDSSPPEVLRHSVTPVERFLRGLVRKLAFQYLFEDRDIVVPVSRQEADGHVFDMTRSTAAIGGKSEQRWREAAG